VERLTELLLVPVLAVVVGFFARVRLLFGPLDSAWFDADR
jgi:hypothetical protein